MISFKRLLLGALSILTLIYTSAFSPYFTTIPPPVIIIEGDWIIDEPIVIVGQTILVYGNIIILSGGSLSLRNSTLFVGLAEDYPKNFTVKTGGGLYVEGSTITSISLGRYWICAETGSSVVISHSKVCNAGYKIQSTYDTYIGPGYTQDMSYFGHGLEFHVPIHLVGNTFINVSSIRFYASNNIVENNTLINIRHEGFAFMNMSKNNVVRYNFICNASVSDGNPSAFNFDRETHGIRFYVPAFQDGDYSEIYGNIIQNVTYGIMIATQPPWIARKNMYIHDNEIRNVIVGLLGALNDSKICNEYYHNFWSGGIEICGHNLEIRNNILVNASFQIPYIWNESQYFNDEWEMFISNYVDNIVSSKSCSALLSPHQRKLFIRYKDRNHNPIKWLFYFNGSHINCAVFNNTLRNNIVVRPANSGEEFSIWYDQPRDYVHYAYTNGTVVFYRRGKLSSNDIIWDLEQVAVSSYPSIRYCYPFITVDSDGYPWITYINYSVDILPTAAQPFITKSRRNDGAWETAIGFPLRLSELLNPSWQASVVPLTNKKVYVVYAFNNSKLLGRLWNGSAMEQEEILSHSTIINAKFHSCTAYRDEINVVFLGRQTESVEGIFPPLSIVHVQRISAMNVTERVVYTPASLTSAPVLAVNQDTGDLLCFWAGVPEAKHVFYNRYFHDRNAWRPFPRYKTVFWKPKPEPLTVNYSVTCNYEFYNDVWSSWADVSFMYLTNGTGEYKVRGYYTKKFVSWFFFRFFIRTREAILLSGGSNITISGNYIAYVPENGFAINMDVGRTLINVTIENNTFDHIADANYAYPAPTKADPIAYSDEPGAVIALEHADLVTIRNNIMKNIAQGITTTFVDSIGWPGRINIQNNLIINSSAQAIRFDQHFDVPGPYNICTISVKNNLIEKANVAILLNNYKNRMNLTEILQNNITNCNVAISFRGSDIIRNCSIYGNNIINCRTLFTASVNGKDVFIYNNNFINYSYIYMNYRPGYCWNMSYSIAGNYWSGYMGVDQYWGPNQNLPGPDGIGDTPHIIDQQNKDYYPLIHIYIQQDIIAVTDIRFSPPPHLVGKNVTIYVELENLANYNMSFYLYLLILKDGNIVFNETRVMSLPPNNIVEAVFTWVPQKWDLHYVLALTSDIPCDAIPQNNSKKAAIVIGPIPISGGGRSLCLLV